MDGKQIIFLINLECLFEIRALYISAIRVVNQKFKFADSINFNDIHQETSNLITCLNLDNTVKNKIEELIIDNISTIKPKLYFILNILTLTKFLSKKTNLSFHIYYDNNLLINETKHKDFILRTKKLISKFILTKIIMEWRLSQLLKNVYF
jgi:hypothetical protein